MQKIDREKIYRKNIKKKTTQNIYIKGTNSKKIIHKNIQSKIYRKEN